LGRIGAAGQSVLRRGADSLRIGIGSIRKKEVNAMTCDEALYRQYLSGDDEGLNALMKKYGDPMTLYIDGYLHDVHESEELMLDVFAYLFTKNPASGTAASRRISIRRRGTWHCAIRANESRCSALMH